MTAPVGARPLVLVVDDDQDIRETLVMLCDSEGYRTAAAVDGLDALAVAEREPPGVILLDLAMPRLDGRGFCQAYRERGGAAPIVLITAALPLAIDETLNSCRIEACIPKPFSIDEILETVARCLPPRA